MVVLEPIIPQSHQNNQTLEENHSMQHSTPHDEQTTFNDSTITSDTSTSSNSKSVKKRQRLTLVCLPCRRKKIKCDKGKPCSNCNKSKPDECIYDERKFEPKKRRRNIHKSHHQHSQQQQQQNFPRSSTPHLQSSQNSVNSSHASKQPQKPSSVEPKHDVCVLIQKSVLEELQAKLKYYENLPSNSSGNQLAQTSQPPPPAPTSITSVQPEPDYDNNDDIVYNKSINTYRNVVFSNHDELRPGFIPVENVASDNMYIYDIKNSTVTSTLHLSRLSSSDELLIGINPYNSPNDFVDFYASIPKVFGRYNRGAMSPLSSTYSIRSGTASRTLRCFSSFEAQKEDKKKVDAGITFDPLKKLILPNDEKVKSMLHLDRSLESKFEEKIELSEDDKLNRSVNSQTPTAPANMTTFAMGLSILGGNKDRESSLIEQIQNAMPPKKVIWLLIQRYFSLLYPIIPYVIEDTFREHTEKLIGKESYEDVKPSEVKIENRVDIAHVGILFVICRLLYLSLFHNRGFYNEQILTKTDLTPAEEERKYLILNAINIQVIEIAQACFIHLQRVGRIKFPLLQLGIYLRSYKVYAPEEGDGLEGGDSFTQHGNLVAMCYILGLNREPDKLPNGTDEKVKNLYRKVWYYQLMQDFSQAHTYGTPLLIKPDSYDTKRPFFTEENSNSRDLDVEKASLSVFAFISSLIRGPVRDIVVLCNKIGEKVKILELTSHLNHLEKGVSQLLGKVSDYTYNLEEKSSNYHTNKILKIGVLFKMNSLIMLLYCHLFNIYELTNSKLAFFYLRKILFMAIIEMLPYVFPLITKSQELFGEAADLNINPTIILFLVRLTDFCLGSLMRAIFSQITMSNDPNHSTKLNTDSTYKKIFNSTGRFIIGMEKTVRVCLTACSILSSRYYFAWITIKLRNYFLKLVTSPEFYERNVAQDLQFVKPTEAQITELADLTDRGMEKVETFINNSCDLVDISTLFKTNKPKKPNKTKKNQHYPSQNTQPPPPPRPQRMPSYEQPHNSQHNPQQYHHNQQQHQHQQQQHPHPHPHQQQQQPYHQPNTSISSHDSVPTNKFSPTINMSEESHTPHSVESNGNGVLYSTHFEDLKFDNGAEIDSIWLQMLNSKTHHQNDGFNGAAGTNNGPMNTSTFNNMNNDSSNLHHNNMHGVGHGQYFDANLNVGQSMNNVFGNRMPPQQFNPTTNQAQDATPNVNIEDNNNTNNNTYNNNINNSTAGSNSGNAVYFDLFDEFPLNPLV